MAYTFDVQANSNFSEYLRGYERKTRLITNILQNIYNAIVEVYPDLSNDAINQTIIQLLDRFDRVYAQGYGQIPKFQGGVEIYEVFPILELNVDFTYLEFLLYASSHILGCDFSQKIDALLLSQNQAESLIFIQNLIGG